MTERRCSKGCGTPSWNRTGRPGLCLKCIEEVFSACALKPLDIYRGPKAVRQCRCLGCGQELRVSFSKIKNVPGRLACEYCMVWSVGKSALVRGDRRVLTPIEVWTHLISNDLVPLGAAPGNGRRQDLGDGISPVEVRCLRCGREDVTSCHLIDDSLRRGHEPCRRCVESSIMEWAENRAREFFVSQGLEYFGGSARMTDAVPARCMRCGSDRKISLSRLLSGNPPCLDCDGHLSPDRPHSVYLVHFAHLAVYKVGITFSMQSGRIRDHVRSGGKILDSVLVENRITAFAVERLILDEVYDYRAKHLTRADLPYGGWTETWKDSGPVVDLAQFVARLAEDKGQVGGGVGDGV